MTRKAKILVAVLAIFGFVLITSGSGLLIYSALNNNETIATIAIACILASVVFYAIVFITFIIFMRKKYKEGDEE